MRHLKSGRKLGRTASHRKATLTNLAASLIEHKSIITTTPKAKEARGVVERLITFAKRGDLAARRQVLRTLQDKTLVKELFDDIAPKYENRPGGYTRVIKIGNRKGDDASMAVFELVGYEGTKAEKIEKARQKRETKVKQSREKAEKKEGGAE
ncbi:50S ribosomal protein L17 [candidate division KSB1 bacterium]|nr:50S ribosomal protein L17 [candidate division KSB1 bacterium]RQW03683.1 MAG: 50S ribosomal protein L17 [candidate division KSB1 bacterium]